MLLMNAKTQTSQTLLVKVKKSRTHVVSHLKMKQKQLHAYPRTQLDVYSRSTLIVATIPSASNPIQGKEAKIKILK